MKNNKKDFISGEDERFDDRVSYNIRDFVNYHTNNKYYVYKTLDVLNREDENVYIFEALDIYHKNTIPIIVLEVVESKNNNRISMHKLDDFARSVVEWWTE